MQQCACLRDLACPHRHSSAAVGHTKAHRHNCNSTHAQTKHRSDGPPPVPALHMESSHAARAQHHRVVPAAQTPNLSKAASRLPPAADKASLAACAPKPMCTSSSTRLSVSVWGAAAVTVPEVPSSPLLRSPAGLELPPARALSMTRLSWYSASCCATSSRRCLDSSAAAKARSERATCSTSSLGPSSAPPRCAGRATVRTPAAGSAPASISMRGNRHSGPTSAVVKLE
mmetsp:Transcript_96459/g.287861  ORF Transcript_96459/g.287861 Transcript_96459/m.287861 type:complete len:229 (-) Transcript_96459:1913-2599(-)